MVFQFSGVWVQRIPAVWFRQYFSPPHYSSFLIHLTSIFLLLSSLIKIRLGLDTTPDITQKGLGSVSLPQACLCQKPDLHSLSQASITSWNNMKTLDQNSENLTQCKWTWDIPTQYFLRSTTLTVYVQWSLTKQYPLYNLDKLSLTWYTKT